MKKDSSENINIPIKKFGLKKFDQINKPHETSSSSLKVPLLLLLIISIFSAALYFRSSIVGVSYAYFPNYTDAYFPKVYQFLKKIKIPFNAELNKMEISNFGATYEKKMLSNFWEY